MVFLLFLIWYMIAILPVLIFNEGNDMLAEFLKKKKIYLYWDSLHSGVVILVVVYIIFYSLGYR